MGISIPIAGFPGIGASILISSAARFNLISSERLTILLTLVPIGGCISNLVTAGPQLISVISAFTPNVSSVCKSRPAVLLFSSRDMLFLEPVLLRSDNGGNSYSVGI